MRECFDLQADDGSGMVLLTAPRLLLTGCFIAVSFTSLLEINATDMNVTAKKKMIITASASIIPPLGNGSIVAVVRLATRCTDQES